MSRESLQQELNPNREIEVTLWNRTAEDFEYTFRTRILSVAESLFLIPAPREHEALMEPGILVGAVLNTRSRSYIFYPKVIRYQYQKPSGYWLQLTDDVGIQTQQRRQHVRAEIVMPIRVELEASPDHYIEVRAETCDISGGGVKFTTSRPFKSGDCLLVCIDFPNRNELEDEPVRLKLDTEVVFCRENPKPASQAEMYVTAGKFVDIADKDEMVIVGECFRWELSRRRLNPNR